MRRHLRFFGQMDKELLKAAEAFRKGCVTALTKSEIGGDVHRRSSDCMDAIDLAEVITGDRTHFHSKISPSADYLARLKKESGGKS